MHRPPCSTAMSNSPATTTMMLTSYDFRVILGQLGGAAPRRRHVPAQGVTKIGLDNSDAGSLIRVIAAFLRSQVANVAVVDKALTTPIETPASSEDRPLTTDGRGRLLDSWLRLPSVA
jgi:hypothetical protein